MQQEKVLNCTYDPLNPIQSPYKFFHPNGSIVTNGYLMNVDGYNDPICIFETKACEDDSFKNACCESSHSLKAAAQVWLYSLIAFGVPYIILQVCIKRMARSSMNKNSTTITPQRGNIWSAMMKNMSPCAKYMFVFIFFASITAMVFESIIMPKSIQQTLSPTDRASQTAMDSFLTPVEEIFAFIEDTMTVKVGYAIASMRYNDLNILLNISVIGGAICGGIAFILMALIALNDDIAGYILNPSEKSNQMLINNGCTLIPSTNDLLQNAKVYWLLNSMTWIPSFMSKGLAGFFIGILELFPYLFPGIISAVVPISLWFGLLNNTDIYPLTILGISSCASTWVICLTYFTYLGIYKNLRKKYKLKCLCNEIVGNLFCGCCRKNDEEDTTRNDDNFIDSTSSNTFINNNDESNNNTDKVDDAISSSMDIRKIIRECIYEGFQLMLVDIAIQLSASITTYVAASEHFEIAFKIAAPQAAYWSFGPQYLMGSMFIFKMMGSTLIASGQHSMFLGLMFFISILTISLMIGAVLAAYATDIYTAYDFGSSACIYATKQECAISYASIFAGKDSLQSVFDAFGWVVGFNLIFVLLRGSLMICHDFDFLAKAAISSFFVVYLPAIFLARFYIQTSVSYYIAMYIPHFALIIVFGWRMYRHVQCLRNGSDGPWTIHTRKMSSFSRGSDGLDRLPTDSERLDTPLLDKNANINNDDNLLQ